MGKCYIDSINDKFVLNGSNIAFNEFTKYKNGKILTLDGVEIIDSTLLSRLTVTGGKLALDGILVNGLNLSSITSDILPTTTTTLNLGSTGLKFSNVWSNVINTSTLNIDTASITFDGTVLKLGTDTIATREWVNSSAIPVLKTINGQSITGTGDITIVGGSGSGGSTFMDIQYGYMSANITSIAPSTFVAFATNTSNGTLDYTAKVDDSTILIKAGVLYKFEGHIGGITDDDASFAIDVSFGLYSDIAGNNLIKPVDYGYEYLNFGTNLIRAYTSIGYIKSDVDCYLKGKVGTTVIADSTGLSLNIRNTLTKYNTTPILTDANGSYTQGRQELPGYSATETLTEKRWIDGKPIYRKVVSLGTITGENVYNYKVISFNTSNIGTIVNGQLISSTGTIADVSFYDTVSNHIEYYFRPDGFVYTCSTNQVQYISGGSVIIEYTKSTDTAGSPVALVGGVQDSYVSKFVGFSAYQTSSQSLTADTPTKITIDTVEFDTQSGKDLTNNRYIAPVSGYYNINGDVNFTSNATITSYIYINGVIYKAGNNIASGARASVSAIKYLNKGDYVELWGWSSVDNTTSKGQYGTYLQVSLIAPNYGGQNTLPNYSTTETLTSERWIDGKPIYKKVVALPAITYDGVWRDISLGNPIAGYETIVSCKLRAKSGEILPDLTTTDLTYRRNWVITPTHLSCLFGSGMSSYMNGSYIVYEYTKTTDTASSPVTTIGGSGTPKKYFARISNGTATSFVRGVTTQIPLSTFAKGDQELHNGTSGFIAPQDDVYTITAQFFSHSSTQSNIDVVTIFCYVNGIEEGRAVVNPGGTGGNTKGCNLTVNTRLNKNDVVTFGMSCWSTDTTASLQVPVGSFISTIRN